MAKKKDFYYKFLIKMDRKMTLIEIQEVRRKIQRVLIDLPIVNIQGGMANNYGYHKFGDEKRDWKSNIKL